MVHIAYERQENKSKRSHFASWLRMHVLHLLVRKDHAMSEVTKTEWTLRICLDQLTLEIFFQENLIGCTSRSLRDQAFLTCIKGIKPVYLPIVFEYYWKYLEFFFSCETIRISGLSRLSHVIDKKFICRVNNLPSVVTLFILPKICQ